MTDRIRDTPRHTVQIHTMTQPLKVTSDPFRGSLCMKSCRFNSSETTPTNTTSRSPDHAHMTTPPPVVGPSCWWRQSPPPPLKFRNSSISWKSCRFSRKYVPARYTIIPACFVVELSLVCLITERNGGARSSEGGADMLAAALSEKIASLCRCLHRLAPPPPLSLRNGVHTARSPKRRPVETSHFLTARHLSVTFVGSGALCIQL
ncbi:Hypothetical predicted protein [Xyrichtys novacula]|uniref:Uncharacterized protein n=1 Tax=Xyrichtys novacula TaxID=13765 RepID=A0AAV1HQ50_XYRNO|nr:Hypothetical predicted protein [Xyrichtys novacula]